MLCGESGCGKTTITKLINGLIPHFTAGEQLTGAVRVDGTTVSDKEEHIILVVSHDIEFINATCTNIFSLQP